ncbi:MAG: hypothetical protein ACJA0T_002918 [Colwellia sp.]|jgi:hypothetical protein
MSLTDLKKTIKAKKKKREFTVDEFIADAENYALAHPEIVNNDNKPVRIRKVKNHFVMRLSPLANRLFINYKI